MPFFFKNKQKVLKKKGILEADTVKQIRQTLRDQLEPLALNSESRIAICRTGQFAELVFLALKEIGIEDFFVPQIFVDGVPIGGFSDLKKIFGSDMPVPKVS